MPVVSSAPYPQVENCLQAARVICNDAAQSILGNLLADTQPFSLPMADLAHKTLRKMLTKAGVNTYSKYGFAVGLGASATTDPTVQMQLMYSGYYNGQLNSATPTLPSDLIEPLELWERTTVSSGVNTASWVPMKQAADSISTRSIEGRFGIWDYESDILYLPPASQSNDLKLKYLVATPRLTSVTQQVPILDCEVAMGALIAELLSMGRGGAEATAQFHARAESEVQLMVSPTDRKEQYGSYNRKPFRGTRAGRRR
jgi:hypothetical protein